MPDYLLPCHVRHDDSPFKRVCQECLLPEDCRYTRQQSETWSNKSIFTIFFFSISILLVARRKQRNLCQFGNWSKNDKSKEDLAFRAGFEESWNNERAWMKETTFFLEEPSRTSCVWMHNKHGWRLIFLEGDPTLFHRTRTMKFWTRTP